ncbi:hypothetical protein AK812_SmicGene7756 [Symbiodinium microadriaticum]|uniref:Uncharacterized protein n=1 Tax=Symbiodinium microadriaticum TaxID=2951 RepID=A0A1Q9EMQ2_SYMMI|nr:hypothetical protein AK812_SmicGene7756 [Symbiodinium microadriaticum]
MASYADWIVFRAAVLSADLLNRTQFSDIVKYSHVRDLGGLPDTLATRALLAAQALHLVPPHRACPTCEMPFKLCFKGGKARIFIADETHLNKRKRNALSRTGRPQRDQVWLWGAVLHGHIKTHFIFRRGDIFVSDKWKATVSAFNSYKTVNNFSEADTHFARDCILIHLSAGYGTGTLFKATRIIPELDTQRQNEAPLKLPPIRMEIQDHLHQRTADFHEWLRHPKAQPRRPSADEAERPPLSWHLLLLRASYNDSSLKATTVADWLAEVLDLPSEIATKHAQAAMTRPAVHLATFPAWSEVTEKADSLRALGLAVQVGSAGIHRAIVAISNRSNSSISTVATRATVTVM